MAPRVRPLHTHHPSGSANPGPCSSTGTRTASRYKHAPNASSQDAMKSFTDHAICSGGGWVPSGLSTKPGVSHRTSQAYRHGCQSNVHRAAYRSVRRSVERRFLDRFQRSEYTRRCATIPLALDFFPARAIQRIRRASDESAAIVFRIPPWPARPEMLELCRAVEPRDSDLRVLSKDARSWRRRHLYPWPSQKKFSGPATPRLHERLCSRFLRCLPEAHAVPMQKRCSIDRSQRRREGWHCSSSSLKSDQTLDTECGEEMLNGIKLATDEHNQDAMPKVRLEVRDTERDAGVAAREISLLCAESQIIAIVGPVFSNEVAAGLDSRQRREFH